MLWDTLAFNLDDMRYSCSGVACLQRQPQDNIWRPSFLSPTGPRTVGDSVMKNDMTATVVAKNLITPKDNILLSKRSDELAESDGQILLDHQRFVGLFQRHLLPSFSRAVPRNEAPNDQPSVPPPSEVLPRTEASNDYPLVPPLSGALSTTGTSLEQPL
ncbi:unnamed protein product [Malus baccata var. baccata]